MVERKNETNDTLWLGPLPPPDLLSEYEKLLPGSSKRLLEIFEQERQRRVELSGEIAREHARYGQFTELLSFSYAALSLVVAAIFLWNQDEFAGAVFGVGGIATAIAVLLLRSLARQDLPEGSLQAKL